MKIDEKVRKKQMRKVAMASIIGTSIEWYDFFLYGTMAALVFPQLFFPESSSFMGVLQAFITLFIGFLARPIGAIIFSSYGDKIGRKAALVTSLLLMGISSTLMGLLPTFDTIGILAPILLVVLRFVQGIGVGGEWGGSVTLSVEWSSEKSRGLMGSMTQLGVPIGMLFSTAVVSLCIFLTGDSFAVWGWRVPFLISIVLVFVGLAIRLGIEESPEFEKMKEENRTAKSPVIESIKEHPKEIVFAALTRLADNVPFYIYTTFLIYYATQHLQIDRQFITNAVLLVSVTFLFVVPLSASLSDKYGRRNITLAGMLLTLVFSYPYFALVNTGETGFIITAIIISSIGPAVVYGPQAALIAEIFPVHLRFSGASIAYQFASIIAGGLAPTISLALLEKFGSTSSISLYVVICCTISIIALFLLKPAEPHKIAENQPKVI
ncbi:MHS family MFS transporter [Mesobacillus maritimus]|uniref:MFS transporter n=1 Tax=Mesobacillus maritimus TaxID=1643336 RepID=UPI00203BB8FE|nr:MFS transporter [Mesobacillus maritimus]MCM3587737.1 MHS family MFS transporter [Mesobacillus maritimus]